MSKAKKSTTGWRRRYVVTKFVVSKTVTVLLLRGRMRRVDALTVKGLVATDKHAKWEWEIVPNQPSFYYTVQTQLFEAAERPEMLAHLAVLRMEGYALSGEVPSW